MSRTVSINTPCADRRRKNIVRQGVRFTTAIGDKLVVFVEQENGDIAHGPTGAKVISSNTIKARLLERYAAHPYGDLPSHRVMAVIILSQIDPDRFWQQANSLPVINENMNA